MEWLLEMKFHYGLLGKFFGEVGEIIGTQPDGTTAPVQVFSVPQLPLYLIMLGWAVVSYLLGSLNFAVIWSKLLYHEDIRDRGSKNPGSTNMLRVYGKKAAILTFVCDLLKGVAAAGLGQLFGGMSCGYVAGLFCVLGHCFPAFYRFKGGKGVATAFGVVTVLEPAVGVIAFIVFIGIVLLGRYVSLGSVMATIVYPMILDGAFKVLYPSDYLVPEASPFALPMLVAICIMLVVLVRHLPNIKRLYRGEESKIEWHRKKNEDES